MSSDPMDGPLVISDTGGMATSDAAADGPGRVYPGKVVAVYVETWTVDVHVESVNRYFTDLPIAVPYVGAHSKAGLYFMPEVDSRCLVFVSASNHRVVLGFETAVKPGTAPNYRGGTPPLEPGDIYLGTVDGNKVVLRKGGMVEIAATPIAKRMYIPLGNLVVDFWQRYRALSPMGEIEWRHEEIPDVEDDGAQDLPVLLSYNFKNSTGEDVSGGRFNVELRIGRLTEAMLDPAVDADHTFGHLAAPSPILADRPAEGEGCISIVVTDPATGSATWAYQVSKAGDEFHLVAGAAHFEYGTKVYVRAGEEAKLEVGDSTKVTVASDGSVVITAPANLTVSTASFSVAAAAVALGPAGGLSLSMGAAGAGVGVGQQPTVTAADQAALDAFVAELETIKDKVNALASDVGAINDTLSSAVAGLAGLGAVVAPQPPEETETADLEEVSNPFTAATALKGGTSV